MSALVSVIIPTYNSAGTIDRAVKSVLAQDYPTIEIIIVDDGSTDETRKVLAQFGADISVFTQPNGGVGSARNTGIVRAKGEFLMFLDADDEMEPTMISQMVAKWTEGRLVVSGVLIGKKAQLPTTQRVMQDLPKHVVRSVLKNGLLYSPWNKLYEAKVVREHNIMFPVDVFYGEDLIFNLRYLQFMKEIFYIKQPLYHYHLSVAGASQKTAARVEDREKMLKALKEYVGEMPEIRLVQMRWKLSTVKAKARMKAVTISARRAHG